MKYTSEDNDSFNELLSKINVEKHDRIEKIYGKEKTQLLLTDGTINENTAEKGKSAETKQIETWKYKAKNSLMFVPDGSHLIKESEEVRRQAPKLIAYSNTRFEDTSKMDIKKAERLQTQEVWKNMITATPALFKNEIQEMQANGERNNYSLVASTPSPNPNKIDPSDMFTWGNIEGTPLLMNPEATPGPVFKIPDTPRRELIGMRLSEKAGNDLRKRQGKLKPSKTPILSHTKRNILSPMISRASSLSPAAKNLLKKSIGTTLNSPLSMKSFGSDDKLKSSYNSPLLYQRPSSYKRPTSNLSTGIIRKSTNIIRKSSVTPQIKYKNDSNLSIEKDKNIPKQSLTDNLLNFNK